MRVQTVMIYLKEELSLIWSLLMSLPPLIELKGSHSVPLFIFGKDASAALRNLDCALLTAQEDIGQIKSALRVVFNALYYPKSISEA